MSVSPSGNTTGDQKVVQRNFHENRGRLIAFASESTSLLFMQNLFPKIKTTPTAVKNGGISISLIPERSSLPAKGGGFSDC